ncbi:MAG: dockerin type I repeat-containing protein [Ruminococcus sp.]|nr:dockerin type I repeat-containing protein [Ruminococcus sp.]MBQ2972531.1 dockerin type I repeat-containing protein [Ruminococcus sp.]MBQ7133146.1 dockerin type I repeat-containing protein [Ruminococcus sp.]
MKKTISILLAVILVVSCAAVAASAYSVIDPDVYTTDEAIAEHELLYGETVETKTYYFLMPNGSNGELGDDETSDFYGKYANDWYKEVTTTPGIYWWGSSIADPTAWAGYLPSGVDENDPDVFYANVPAAVTTIIWNNGIDGGLDTTLDIYYKAAQTVNIGAEYYEAGESDNYPDGTETFDGMIYVIDPDLISISDFSLKEQCGGEWYYYYGNGCYGFTPDGTEADCLRDDHFDAEGNHVGGKTSEDPTDAPTDAPTDVPTEDPNPGEYILGDADGDGEVSVMDASLIQMFLVGKKDIVGDEALAADADKDGEISVMDASLIQMYLVGKKELG